MSQELVTSDQTQPSNDVPITNRPSHTYRLSFIEQLTQHALPLSEISAIQNESKTGNPFTTVNHVPSIQLTTIHSNSTALVDQITATPSAITITRPTSIAAVTLTTIDTPIPSENANPTLSRIESDSNPALVSSISSIDFNVMDTNNANSNVSNTYIILYYLLRLFSIIVTLFLSIMALNYAIGQVYVLEAADLFCPNEDEDTLRNYNLEHDLPHGRRRCGNINRVEIDDEILWGDPYEPVPAPTANNIIACIAFLALFLCLSVLGLYHLCICFSDAFYHFIRKDPTKNPRIVKALKAKKNTSANKCVLWFQKWNLRLFKRYYPDSKLKIIMLTFSQASEILMQCWALLIYGGVQSVSLSFVIANEPRFVQSFAVIVGLNGIVTGILWILYVTKIKVLNAIFHGTSFQSIAFVVDMVFDFLYTMFPFTLHSQNSSLLFNIKALATLHSENGILFFAAFIAMTMLFQKCMTVLWSFDPVQIQKRAQKIIKHNIDLVPYLQPTYVPPDSASSDHELIKEHKQWQAQQLRRRICIGSIGAVFLAFGTALIIIVSVYIQSAHQTCANPSPQLLMEHPELYYWDKHCSSKLTPLDSSITPCDCRSLDIKFNMLHYNEYNFTKQHVLSIMRNFRMMTFLELDYSHSLLSTVNQMSAEGNTELAEELFYVNLTSDCFASKRLNSLSLERMFIIDLDWNGLASLKRLQMLRLVDCRFRNPVDWDSIGQLTYLKYLNMQESGQYLSGPISDSICHLKELKYLDIETNLISRIPECIADLKELYAINLRGLPNVEYITPDLFRLPHIVSIIAYYGSFNTSSIPADGDWSASLETVFLQQTPLCNQVDQMTSLQMEFMDAFDPCYKPCGESEGMHGWCATYDWGNGNCESECCNYDGGDCHQTCPCERSLWFNDQCDLECNNTLCAFDFGDCLPQQALNGTGECVYGSGCLDDWQDDGWCDGNCAVLRDEDCADVYDCTAEHQCDSSSECSIAYIYLIHNGARVNDPKELIDINETCMLWDFVRLLDPTIGDCKEEFPRADLNHDGYVSFWEAIQIAATMLGLSAEKAEQVNCSLCLTDPSLYY
eukprot:211819_1